MPLVSSDFCATYIRIRGSNNTLLIILSSSMSIRFVVPRLSNETSSLFFFFILSSPYLLLSGVDGYFLCLIALSDTLSKTLLEGGIGPSQRPLPDNTTVKRCRYPQLNRFEPVILASEGPQTHALDRAATVVGLNKTYILNNLRPRTLRLSYIIWIIRQAAPVRKILNFIKSQSIKPQLQWNNLICIKEG